MTKEETKAKLRKAKTDLRLVNSILERHEQYIKEIKEEIAKLEAIINKPDRWQDGLVQPDKEQYFFLTSSAEKGLFAGSNSNSRVHRKPEHAFKTQEQAELIKEKMLLMQEMHAFAHVRNEGWMPDWGDEEQVKYGIIQIKDEIVIDWFAHVNPFVFGVAVKSKEIAEEMLEIFGERIEKVYNKMY